MNSKLLSITHVYHESIFKKNIFVQKRETYKVIQIKGRDLFFCCYEKRASYWPWYDRLMCFVNKECIPDPLEGFITYFLKSRIIKGRK